MTDTAALEHARRVADAVLYEGYLLYPYRHSSQKNMVRFQFGVLMPPAYAELDDSEPSANQTECLLECGDDALVRVRLRFLHVQHRTVAEVAPETGALRQTAVLRVDGIEYTPWDEATEREQVVEASLTRLLAGGTELTFRIAAGRSSEDVRPGCPVRTARSGCESRSPI